MRDTGEHQQIYKNSTNIYVDLSNQRVLLTKKGTDILYEIEPPKKIKVNEITTYQFEDGQMNKICE
jgi:hypothetical protein